MASSTDAAGAVTHYTYDAYGNLASETDPDGNVTDYTYDAERAPADDHAGELHRLPARFPAGRRR